MKTVVAKRKNESANWRRRRTHHSVWAWALVANVWLGMTMTTQPAAAQSLCHEVSVALVQIQPSLMTVYSGSWNQVTGFMTSGSIAPGRYSLTLEFVASVSPSTNDGEAACFIEGDIEFDLTGAPASSVYGRRISYVEAGVWGLTDQVSETDNFTNTGGNYSPSTIVDGVIQIGSFQVSHANLRMDSGFAGNGAQLSARLPVSASNALVGFGDPNAISRAELRWFFDIATAADWSLAVDAEGEVVSGLSAYFPTVPLNYISGPTTVEGVIVDAPVMGWIADDTPLTLIAVPQPPVTAIVVETPPSDLDRGEPYEVRANGMLLGSYAAGQMIDLVAALGSGASDVSITPLGTPGPGAPLQLPLGLTLSASGGEVRTQAVPEPAVQLMLLVGGLVTRMLSGARRKRE